MSFDTDCLKRKFEKTNAGLANLVHITAQDRHLFAACRVIVRSLLTSWVTSHFFGLDNMRQLLNIKLSRILEGIESLVCVSDEGQTHLRVLFRRNLPCLRPMYRTVVLLWDFIDGKVANVDV